MRNAEKFNPMTHGRSPVNASAGEHMGKHSPDKHSGGAGSLMGPSIAKGYLVTGKGDTHATGGKFRGAHKAKRVKGGKTQRAMAKVT